jgi:hypothetical protein
VPCLNVGVWSAGHTPAGLAIHGQHMGCKSAVVATTPPDYLCVDGAERAAAFLNDHTWDGGIPELMATCPAKAGRPATGGVRKFPSCRFSPVEPEHGNVQFLHGRRRGVCAARMSGRATRSSSWVDRYCGGCTWWAAGIRRGSIGRTGSPGQPASRLVPSLPARAHRD